MDLTSFEVDSVVLHDVPRPDDPDEDLVLTNQTIDLDEQLRAYFRRKITRSLATRGVEVLADEHEDPTVRAAVTEATANPNRLVPASRAIAQHLYEIQTGRNSPGLLAVLRGSVDERPCLSILKLEREQGLRVHIEVAQGTAVVDLELLRDLTLTDRTKVFKTSLLRVAETPESLEGRVSDDQRGRDEGVGVATFFLTTFLGCKLRISPDQATRQFAEAAEKFFNEQVHDAERRARYQVALLAKLQDNSLDLQPRDFARGNLEPADRSTFLDYVRDGGIETDTAFEKDVSLARAKGFKMIFQSGMALTGSLTDLERRVEPRQNGSGAEINDPIARLQGR
jgi:hypothetical protein